MKKNVMMKVFLVLLPVMAVLLGTTGNSVTVFDTVSRETTYYSYFDLAPVGAMQICPPLAAVLAAVSAIIAAVYAATNKDWTVKTIYWLSLGATILAVLPVILRGEVLMVPNVMLPILMICQWIMGAVLKKKPMAKKNNEGKRLSAH